MQVTGPKISSCTSGLSSGRLVKMCGWMNSPFFNAGSDGMAEQARPSAPAVALPCSM